MTNRLLACVLLATSPLPAACSVMSKAEPLDIGYFEPVPPAASKRAVEPGAGSLELRLGRITSAEHLRQAIVYRKDGVELGSYEDRRWTERPEVYMARELGRALFEDQGLVQIVSGARPTLDVELLAFEELRGPRGPRARVALRYALSDDRRVVLADTVIVERPLEGAGPVALARALGAALRVAADRVGARVAAKLAEHAQGP